MRKAILCLMVFTMLILPVQASAEPPELRVVYMDKELTARAAPFLLDGRSMVPIDWFPEYFGADIGLRGRSFWLRRSQVILTFEVGSRYFSVNGKTVEMDVPVVERNGGGTVTTFVPLRFVVETLGGQLAWDESTRTVTIAPELPQAMTDDEVNAAIQRLCALKLFRCWL